MDGILYQAIDYARLASSYTSSIIGYLYRTLSPIIGKYANTQSELMNIALLVVVLYLSLTILRMASRWIYGVLVTVVRLLFLLSVVVMAAWIWQRGDAVSDDVKRLTELVGKATGAGGGTGERKERWRDSYAGY